MSEEVIKFKGRSATTGFLSNESYFKFNLGGKTWKTVEHYILAQKFVGTQLEEEIQKAPTVHQAKALARQRRLITEKQGKMIKKKVYGKGKQYHIREDWNEAKKGILEKALKAKFRQNKSLQKKLLETGNSRLEDLLNPDTGPILEQIREKLRLEKEAPRQPVRKPAVYKDIVSGKLKDSDRVLVQSILLLAERISVVEGWEGQLYPGMVEDAVYTFTKRSKSEFLKKFVEGYIMQWNRVYTNMPQFRSLVLEIQDLIPSNAHQRKKIALALANIVKEFRLWDSEIQNKVIKRVKSITRNLKGIKLRYLKRKREYRKGTPPKMPKRLLTKKEKRYIEIAVKDILISKGYRSFERIMREVGMEEALKKEDFISFLQETFEKLGIEISDEEREILKKQGLSVKFFEKVAKKESPKKIKVPENLVLKEQRSKSDFFVIGKPLENPHQRQNLLRLGGTFPKFRGKINYTKVKFPGYLKRDVEDYLFLEMTPEKKWSLVIKLWQANKYLTLLDTLVQVTKLEGKTKITKETASFVMHKLYGCIIEDLSVPDKNIGECVEQMMKSRYPHFKIDPEALSLLVEYISTIKNKLEPLENLGRREYLLKLDEMVGWGTPEKNADVLVALNHLADLLSTYLKKPINKEVCEGAFLVLLPPISIKIGAEQYISNFIKELENSDLSQVAEKYKIEVDGEETCSLVFSVASKYIESLMKKPELSWLSGRIQMMATSKNKACDEPEKSSKSSD